MKKVLFLAFAAVAISFASCGNKANNAAPEEVAVDSAALVEEANASVDEMITKLTEGIEAKDANKLQEIIEAVKAKAAEILAVNPEIAKEYLTKVQNFLKENADKVKEVIGGNAAVASALAAFTDAPVDNVVEGLSSYLNAGKEAVEGAVEGAKDAVDGAVDAAKEKAADAVNQVQQKGADVLDAAQQKANEAVDNAQKKAADEASKAVGNAAKKLGL